jgi:hypothetical protein
VVDTGVGKRWREAEGYVEPRVSHAENKINSNPVWDEELGLAPLVLAA